MVRPTYTEMLPALPEDALPVLNRIPPALPETEEPVERRMAPDAVAPACPVAIVMAPVTPKASPVEIDMAPECPVVDAAPPVPVAIVTVPVLPPPVVPLLNSMLPERPTVLAFEERTTTEPDDDDRPAPEVIVNAPPTRVLEVVAPAMSCRLPPVPLLLRPMKTEIEPAVPDRATPVARTV